MAARVEADLAGGLRAPYQVVLKGYDRERETVRTQSPAGDKVVSVLFPFQTNGAWIRGAPEPNTSALMVTRSDTQEPEMLRYFERDGFARIDSYRADASKTPYRMLNPGELDLASSGLVQQWFGSVPVMDRSAGAVTESLNQDTLTAEVRSPTHVRALHLNQRGSIGDEERFGVVQRWRDKGLTGKSRYRRKWVKSDRLDLSVGTLLNAGVGFEVGPWAKEYLRILSSGASLPDQLVEIREGDVIDDDGDQITSDWTQKPLRAMRRYYTSLGQFVSSEIDEAGNVLLTLPRQALDGLSVRIPFGDFAMSVGQAMKLSVQRDFGAVVRGTATLLPMKLVIGGAGNEKAVLGDTLKSLLSDLISKLKSAQYMGPTGPATMSPADQVALSTLSGQLDTMLSSFIFLSQSP